MNVALAAPHLERYLCIFLPFPCTHYHSAAMEHWLCRTWIFFFVCWVLLGTRLDEAANDYCKPMSFATFKDWFFVKLDAFRADAPPALRTLAQNAVVGSESDFHQASAIRAKARLSKKADGRVLCVASEVLARPHEQRRSSPLYSMLSSVVRGTTIYCFSSSLVFVFLTDTGSVRYIGLVVSVDFIQMWQPGLSRSPKTLSSSWPHV